MPVERRIVQALGGLAVLGAVVFGVWHVWAVTFYLGLSGVLFWAASWGWRARFQEVLAQPPTGAEPTPEVYRDPGRQQRVRVWRLGDRRWYVLEPPGGQGR
ncbi:Tetrathionate reductase subunit C [Candidatus Hydrogenisulfobacillus filiaventi]|uniref:Tetrathionate reductase subunit C n=1 Tax=Candidatus Hydrogenisulfobacillus filiaventi TaxID=2707344 RepID=A0A6F8ZGA4_9FIRM|nr:hypothetical protein [Bacillota bacterium]CAB1128810.1 Tetrathionate reductase subunit C [Candidatus Hydrogenisulfobacillus filiaventi]